MTVRSGFPPANTPAVRSAPRRGLWLLATLVVLGHWWLLDAIPRDVNVGPAMDPVNPKMLVFNTRRLEVSPVQAAPVVLAAPAQPQPVLIQKLKRSQPDVALPEPLPQAPVVAEAQLAPAQAELAPTLPVEPDASPQTAADAPKDSPTAGAQPTPPQAQAQLNIPGSVRLKYQMTGLSRSLTYHATGVMTWLQDGSHYEANMVVSAFLIGSRSLNSVGDITVDGLAPKRFADKGRSELAAHFQADKGKITFSANTPDAPWKRGAQDRLSVFFQLASLLAGQPEGFPLGTKFPIYTAGQRDVDTWTFSVTGSEVLNLPHSAVQAIKLTRDPRQEFDQLVEVWFAPTLGYWPVRIKITQSSGDYIDQQLSSSGPP
jgi:hypothetical protein